MKKETIALLLSLLEKINNDEFTENKLEEIKTFCNNILNSDKNLSENTDFEFTDAEVMKYIVTGWYIHTFSK